MPVDADVADGGYGAGGVGAGMGSGTGGPEGGPASASNPGVSTGQQEHGRGLAHGDSTVADAARDAMRGWDSSPLSSFGAGSPTGTHPDQDVPGFGADDVDYGFYDAYPGTQFSPMEFGPQGYQSPHESFSGYGNFGDGLSPMGHSGMLGKRGVFGPSQQEIEAMVENAANAAVSSALGFDADLANTTGATTPAPQDTFDADLANTTGATTPAPTTTPPPPQVSKYDQKQFYSALDDPNGSLKAKDLEMQGFMSHIERPNYANQGFLAKTFGILGPKLQEHQRVTQIENFLAKSGTQKSIQALNNSYTHYMNENPHLDHLLKAPGVKAIRGLMSKLGMPHQYTHPTVQALYDKMEKLGMIDNRPEQELWTEAQKKADCESKPGWRWDTEAKACVPINQESDGQYNPYLGILG